MKKNDSAFKSQFEYKYSMAQLARKLILKGKTKNYEES